MPYGARLTVAKKGVFFDQKSDTPKRSKMESRSKASSDFLSHFLIKSHCTALKHALTESTNLSLLRWFRSAGGQSSGGRPPGVPPKSTVLGHLKTQKVPVRPYKGVQNHSETTPKTVISGSDPKSGQKWTPQKPLKSLILGTPK